MDFCLQLFGKAYLVDAKPVLRDGVETGNYTATFRFMGGNCSVVVAGQVLQSYSIGQCCSVWFDVEPIDAGYLYQGRHVPRQGFRILSLIKMEASK